MKKFIAVLCCVFTLLSFSACAQKQTYIAVSTYDELSAHDSAVLAAFLRSFESGISLPEDSSMPDASTPELSEDSSASVALLNVSTSESESQSTSDAANSQPSASSEVQTSSEGEPALFTAQAYGERVLLLTTNEAAQLDTFAAMLKQKPVLALVFLEDGASAGTFVKAAKGVPIIFIGAEPSGILASQKEPWWYIGYTQELTGQLAGELGAHLYREGAVVDANADLLLAYASLFTQKNVDTPEIEDLPADSSFDIEGNASEENDIFLPAEDSSLVEEPETPSELDESETQLAFTSEEIIERNILSRLEDAGIFTVHTASSAIAQGENAAYPHGAELLLCLSEESALWAASAFGEGGAWEKETLLPVLSAVCTPEIYAALESGQISGAVLQNPQQTATALIHFTANILNDRFATANSPYTLIDGCKLYLTPTALTADNDINILEIFEGA